MTLFECEAFDARSLETKTCKMFRNSLSFSILKQNKVVLLGAFYTVRFSNWSCSLRKAAGRRQKGPWGPLVGFLNKVVVEMLLKLTMHHTWGGRDPADRFQLIWARTECGRPFRKATHRTSFFTHWMLFYSFFPHCSLTCGGCFAKNTLNMTIYKKYAFDFFIFLLYILF